MGRGQGPLAGIRVLEIGHFVAAPFCARLLADLGADVIKIEPPGGDPIRQWGKQLHGRSVWWSLHGRNKRSVALNLKHRRAVDVVLRIVRECDALIENFRPGHLKALGLSEEALRDARADLVIARISGFGQEGPYKDRAAFGVIGEAMGGLRFLTNHPPVVTNLPPPRMGVSLGDSLAGVYAAFGVMAALWQRDRTGGDSRGCTLDVALTDAVISMMEGMLPEYGALGVVKQPCGSRISTAAPSNASASADGKWVLIAANSDPLFARLAQLMLQPELACDRRFANNKVRVENVEELDSIISVWTVRLTAEELVQILTKNDVPCCHAYSAVEIAADPHFRSRGMVTEVDDPLLGRVLHPGIVPHVCDDVGRIRWCGPDVGAHTDEVLAEVARLSNAEIDDLRHEGVISP